MNGIEKAIRESGQHPGWTPELVAKRLQEAADTLRRIPPDGFRPQGYKSAWPDVVQRLRDEFPLIDAVHGLKFLKEHRARRIAEINKPSPAEPGAITRMDEAFRWLVWIEDEIKRRALAAWIAGAGDRRTAFIVRKSRQTVRNWREQSLELIARRLNG